MTSYLIAFVLCLISTSYAYRVPAITSCKSAGTYLASGTLLCIEGQDIAVSHDTEYKGSQCARLGSIIFSEKVYPLTCVVCSPSENRVTDETVGVVYEWKKYQIVRKVFDGRKRLESACPLEGDYLLDQTHLCHNHELIKVEYVKDNDRFCDKDEPAITFSLTDNTPREFYACVRISKRSRASIKYRYATDTEISTDSTTFSYGKPYLKGCGTNRKIIPLTTSKVTTICYDGKIYTLNATDDWRNVNCDEGEIQKYSDDSNEEFEICEQYLSCLAFRLYTERRDELSARENSKRGLMSLIPDNSLHILENIYEKCSASVRELYFIDETRTTARVCFNQQVKTLSLEEEELLDEECEMSSISTLPDRRDGKKYFKICVYNEYKRLVNRVFSFQWVEYFNEKMTAKKNTIPEKRGFTAEKRGVLFGPDLFCGDDIFFEDGSVTFISREENTAKVCDSGVEVELFKTGAIIDGLSCTSPNQVSKESSEIYCVCDPILAGTTLHGCPAYATKTNEKQIYGDTRVIDPVVSEKSPCYGFEGLKIISGKTTDDVITICVNEKFVNLQISQETLKHVKCSPADSRTAIATIVNQARSYAICQPNNMYKIYSQV